MYYTIKQEDKNWGDGIYNISTVFANIGDAHHPCIDWFLRLC